MIRFRLSAPTPSLNETLRWHWAKKKKAQKAMAWGIKTQPTSGSVTTWDATRRCTVEDYCPIPRARVRITRHGSRLLDEDNLIGGCKGLVDVLKPASKSNPYGLGIIAGDEPDKLALTVWQVKCARADACTWVEIEEWADEPH